MQFWVFFCSLWGIKEVLKERNGLNSFYKKRPKCEFQVVFRSEQSISPLEISSGSSDLWVFCLPWHLMSDAEQQSVNRVETKICPNWEMKGAKTKKLPTAQWYYIRTEVQLFHNCPSFLIYMSCFFR